MTQDEIIRMAVECQLVTTNNRDGVYMQALERFATLVAEAERKQTLCEAAAIVLMSPSREAAVDVLQEMGK